MFSILSNLNVIRYKNNHSTIRTKKSSFKDISRSRRLNSTKILDIENHGESRLKNLNCFSKNVLPKNENIVHYDDIWDISNIIKGYKRIKGKKSPGIDGVANKDLKQVDLDKISKELKNQSYIPKPNKRVAISKSDGKISYLGIASVRDKVVQGAILNLLEPIIEPEMAQNSYGFRKNKGCHEALKEIRHKWQNISWIINVDIRKLFYTIDHDILFTKLEKFMDQASIELIRKLSKAGYIQFKNLVEVNIGVPQGSLISPALCNIYFMDFDTYINEAVLNLYNKGEKIVENLEYKKIRYFSSKDREILEVYPQLKDAIFRIKHQRTINQKQLRTQKTDINFVRLYYIRYADDFVFGLVGSKSQAKEIFNLVKTYLGNELKFEINLEKSSIIHSTNNFKYLGTLIKWQRSITQLKRSEVGGIKSLNRPHMTAPVKDILDSLVERGFAKKSKDGSIRGTSYRKIINKELKDIVNKFNGMIRGLLNYYSFVNSRSMLWKIISVYRKSCALTIADKLKIGTANKVYYKFGPKISIKNEVGEEVASLSAWPITLKTNYKFLTGLRGPNVTEIYEKLLDKDQPGFFKRDNSGLTCEYSGCFSTKNLESHYINPVVDIRKRRDISIRAKSLLMDNRKMVLLCRAHYEELHRRRIFVKEPPTEVEF